MKLAIGSLMLLAATTVIALPTPEQAEHGSCIIYKDEVNRVIQKRCPIDRKARSYTDREVDGVIEKRYDIPWTKNGGEYDHAK